jgi:hypothetical protein
VSDSAGRLALLAAYATFWMDEDGFHVEQSPFQQQFCEKQDLPGYGYVLTSFVAMKSKLSPFAHE